MTDFNQKWNFGGLNFYVDAGTLTISFQRHTKKQTLPGSVLETPIAFNNDKDRVLSVSCLLYRGESAAEKTQFDADVALLNNIVDFKPYTLSTGNSNFNGTYVILPYPTQNFSKNDDKMLSFSMTLLEW